ncbi:DUF1217 domain-containing protein [Frigidibacter albus]|uniref:DUF1217 domain-containing protein n=1 Tax=Frigidibacter albus TaxID=1465486 RepID=A0A6L8VLR5_9RHOB|nr:DUF1217 domain-containing protein [Frigidibacter albus]MZQ90299.1 DUF1217 domain-containing protein [Frigidibacter albus]NBE32203.1 DUF1217 domain-containing protein [Frigidibacter albus]GGH58631.1 flagellar basal body rod protein FlgF [Frigidibacter albus]
MSFAPVVPFGGFAGWSFLTRTMEAQKQAFTGQASVQRDTDYFREKIGSVKTAEDLVSDRRLLRVALGAFGLQDDIDSRFFIHKVLSDGTLDTTDLANRLSDKSYYQLASAFAFDLATPGTQVSTFADGIIAAFQDRQFEEAVGGVNGDMRLALNARRELADLAGRQSSEDTKWFTILGSAPLRSLFQTAFGLPASFAGVDLDQQLGTMKDLAERYLGSDKVAQFAEPERVDDLIKLFLLRAQAREVASLSGGAVALSLLQNAQSGSLLSRLA